MERIFEDLERMKERDDFSKYGSRTIYGVEIEVTDELDDEDEDEDERTRCFYCDEWDPEDKHIYFVYNGKVECCCEKCLWGLIHEDRSYEDAIMVLQNRVGGSTGITAVDMMADRLIQQLEKANEAEMRRDSALYSIEEIRRVGA
jgi:hypothetical protein